MTIRNFLLKALEKRGVKVDTEVSYTTPIGRLVPDMLLHNGAQYVVETKLDAEAKLLDAMVRLYDYSKYTPAKGAFAVLFPKELRQPWNIEILGKIAQDPKLEYVATATFKDLRPSQRFAGNLAQMADWMASQVLRPPVVEADTSFAIKVLTDAHATMGESQVSKLLKLCLVGYDWIHDWVLLSIFIFYGKISKTLAARKESSQRVCVQLHKESVSPSNREDNWQCSTFSHRDAVDDFFSRVRLLFVGVAYAICDLSGEQDKASVIRQEFNRFLNPLYAIVEPFMLVEDLKGALG